MTEDFLKYMTCVKCHRFLTPQEVGCYGTASPPRCESCRTVHRNFTPQRIRNVVAEAQVTPYNVPNIRRSPSAYAVLQPIQYTSWVAYLIINEYLDAPAIWDIYNGFATYTTDDGQHIKQRVARFARKHLNKELVEKLLRDQDFELFNNEAVARSSIGNVTWELLSGEDIRSAYHEDCYAKQDIGQLEHSCMRYQECQPYFDIYVKNPDVCQLLTAWNEQHELIGRALLWKLTDGQFYLDRVYANDFMRIAFKNYAAETYNVQLMFEDEPEVAVQLSEWTFHEYPYCDTMLTLDPFTGILKSSSCWDKPFMWISRTDGTFGTSDNNTFETSTHGWRVCPKSTPNDRHYEAFCTVENEATTNICPLCEAVLIEKQGEANALSTRTTAL